MRWNWLLWFGLLLGGGILFIEMGNDEADRRTDLKYNGVTTSGWIEYSEEFSSRRGGKTYEMRVHFEDHEGKQHEKTFPVGKDYHDDHVGSETVIDQNAIVLFDPADPIGSAYLKDAYKSHPSTTGILFTIVGFGGIVFTLTQRKKKESVYQ